MNGPSGVVKLLKSDGQKPLKRTSTNTVVLQTKKTRQSVPPMSLQSVNKVAVTAAPNLQAQKQQPPKPQAASTPLKVLPKTSVVAPAVSSASVPLPVPVRVTITPDLKIIPTGGQPATNTKAFITYKPSGAGATSINVPLITKPKIVAMAKPLAGGQRVIKLNAVKAIVAPSSLDKKKVVKTDKPEKKDEPKKIEKLEKVEKLEKLLKIEKTDKIEEDTEELKKDETSEEKTVASNENLEKIASVAKAEEIKLEKIENSNCTSAASVANLLLPPEIQVQKFMEQMQRRHEAHQLQLQTEMQKFMEHIQQEQQAHQRDLQTNMQNFIEQMIEKQQATSSAAMRHISSKLQVRKKRIKWRRTGLRAKGLEDI